MALATRRAVFIDKDGTLLDDVPYNIDPVRMRLSEGAAQALPAIVAAGFELIVVSNQSGVARGMFPESALTAVEGRLREMLDELGVPLRAFCYCPHHPQGVEREYTRDCDCRKPAPGMIRRAAAEHGIARDRSWMIGDILDDVEAGRRAGCQTVLLDNAHETRWERRPDREPHYIARGLAEAASIVRGAAA